MNILYINSCIRKESRTKKIADEYLKKISSENSDVIITEVELQKTDMSPLNAEVLEKRNRLLEKNSIDVDFFKLARQFAEADKIVIAAPYYDLQFPALLKIYLENICVCGITFCYNEKGIPVGLCKADELIYITTAGGYIGDFDFGYDYICGLCKMFGVANQKEISAEGLDIIGTDEKEILADTIKTFA